MAEEFDERMRRFGFTRKEAETYRAILELGPTTVSEITEETDVSTRHVYNIVQKLEDRKFVIINDFINPTTIEAVEPEQLHKSLKVDAENIHTLADSRYQRADSNEKGIEVLKSRSAVVEKVQTMISSAKERIAMSLPSGTVTRVGDALREAVDDDVTVLLLLFGRSPGETQVPDIDLDGLGHVVRYRDIEIPVLGAIDRKYGIVSQHSAMGGRNNRTNAIFFRQPYVETVVFNALINTEWVVADEIHTACPDELPHTYTNIRQAVINAALHERDGKQLQIEAEVRSTVDTNRVTQLSGEVTSLSQRLVEPVSDANPGQCCIGLRDGSEIVTVGGNDARVEDYRAYSITLKSAD